MSIENKTDEELEQLDRDLAENDITEEQEKDLLPQVEQKPEEFIVEITDDQKDDADNGGQAPPPVKTEDNPPPPPTEQPKPALTDEQYNAIITEHPQMAKFKNDENFLSNLTKSYVELETKLGTPKSPTESTPPPITDQQKLAELNKTVLARVEREMLTDPKVLDNLVVRDEEGKIVETLTLPKTQGELAKFKRDYPAEYGEIIRIGEEKYNQVYKEVVAEEQKTVYAPQFNEKATDELIANIEGYFKKIAPNATDADFKTVGERFKAFYEKAVYNPQYRTDKGRFINTKAMFGDFLGESADLIGNLTRINAANGTQQSVKQAVQNVQKKTSMKTLGNQGLNTGSRKQVNVYDRKQTDSLSDEQIDKLEDQIINHL